MLNWDFVGCVCVAAVGLIIAGSGLIEFYFARKEEYGKSFVKRINELAKVLETFSIGQKQ